MKSLYILSFLASVLLLGCEEKREPDATVSKRTPPNIIWLVAEDQSPQFFPMYGNQTIALPNLEGLAADGVVFDNAVAPVPVCAPARSSLITGMYPTTLGTHNMRTHAPWRGDGESPYPSLGIPSYSPIVPDGVKMFPEYLRKEGYYTVNGPKEDYNFEKTDAAWYESSPERHWRKREDGQPFFAVFNFAVCHESQIWKRGRDSLFVAPEQVPVPPYLPDTPVIRHDLAVNYSNLKRLDDQIGEVIADLKEDGLYENSIIFFYGDHGGPFPRHKRALYDTGLKVPMIIKFSKNENSGSRDERLISFIDYAPTVLSMAGIEPPKVMQGTAQFGKFEVTDPSEYTFHTADRFDAIYDRLRAVRSKRFKYIKSYNTDLSHALPVAYREQMPIMQELRNLYKEGKLNDDQASWLKPTKPEEELYDLQKDPFELDNLAQKKEFQDTLRHYRSVLNEWIKETNDLGRIDESELIERWVPDGKPPRLEPLQMEETDEGMVLNAAKPDASVVWKVPNDSIWNIYVRPLPKNRPFEAKAERIGYGDSEILVFEGD